MKRILMNKNKKVLLAEYDKATGVFTNVYEIYDINYAPYILKNSYLSNDINDTFRTNLTEWFKGRGIPSLRDKLDLLLHRLNINAPCELLDKAFGLSLSDQYFLCPLNSNIKYEDINFFDNEFSEDIGKILFNGGKTALNLNLNTPDMTSNGNYEKRWKIIDGERYLLKAGSKIYNQEPFNELIATKLYERLLNKDEYVEYSVIFDDDKAISKCKNFITKDTELVPAWKINEYYEFLDDEDKYTHYIRCLNNLGIKDAETLTDKMIVCDYIIANKDRHFNNFGVIRDVNTLKFIGVAPIFDNGCSLWYDENDMYVGEFFLTKPFEEYEKTQLSLVKKLEWLDISKLEDFPNEVKTILSIDKLLSKERINKIVDQIKLRIEFVKELKKSREVDADNGCEI